MFVVVITTIGLSQSQQVINPAFLSPVSKVAFDKIKFSHNKTNATTATVVGHQGWFNYGTGAEAYYFRNPQYYVANMFPDSLGYIDDGTGLIGPSMFYHLAELVDFKSPVFSTDMATSWVASYPLDDFIIDSMSVGYSYIRNHPNVNIVDTLIITVYDNSTPTNLTTSFFTGVIAANYYTDTISYKEIGINQVTNSVATSNINNPAGVYQFKVLLTQQDSSGSLNSYRPSEKKFALPVPFKSNGSNLVIADVLFKPGYSYTVAQRVDLTANTFLLLSSREDQIGSYMHHTDCNYASSSCDYSMSYMLMKSNRYNFNATNNKYYPSIEFSQSPFLEHHYIYFHLLDTIISPCVSNASFAIIGDTTGNYYAYDYSSGTGSLSYLWNFGDGTTSTLQYPSHQYSPPGQYVVCLTLSATSGTTTCSNTYCDSSSVHKSPNSFTMSSFNVIPQTTTSIKQLENVININAYPNPITDELTIDVTIKDNLKVKYILVDALGRTIYVGSVDNGKSLINTASLEKGFYNLSIINSKGDLLRAIKLAK